MSKPLTFPAWPEGMPKPLAAAYSGRSVRDLERLVAAERIIPRRDGKRLIFLKADLDRFLAELPRAKPTDVARPGEAE